MAAKRRGKTWRRDPRNVVARLIAENPKAGKKKWKEAFRIAIRGKDGGDALDSVADYWFETGIIYMTPLTGAGESSTLASSRTEPSQ